VVDLKKAVSYIQSKSDPIENARLTSILWGQTPDESVLSRLEAMQNPDGGFCYWTKEADISMVCDTVCMLRWFDDLSLQNSPLVEQAVGFLFSHQKEDGGWDEVEDIRQFNPPPFLQPGAINARVWLSAHCAHWLMRFGYAESPMCKACPVDFLLENREPDGRLIGYIRATWDALPIFARYPENDREPFKQALRIIEEEYSPEKWEGSYLAWLLRCLYDAHLETSHNLVKDCLKQIEHRQRPDGSWDSEDGEEYTAGATLEVLRVFKDYKVV
jgi:hypothetical protein